MIDNFEIYPHETTSVNELKGFTKSFQKRSREKREEDVNIKEIMSFVKEKRGVVFGSRMCEKNFKKGNVKKIFLSSSCDEMTKEKLMYYADILEVECVLLDIDSDEVGVRLSKPFLISVVSFIGGENV